MNDKKPVYTIYAIKHNVTGKILICSTRGEADGPTRNALSLLRRGAHGNRFLQADHDKYGDDYSFYIIDRVKGGDRYTIYEYVEKYKSYLSDVGYNQRRGLEASSGNILFSEGIPQVNKPTSGQQNRQDRQKPQFTRRFNHGIKAIDKEMK